MARELQGGNSGGRERAVRGRPIYVLSSTCKKQSVCLMENTQTEFCHARINEANRVVDKEREGERDFLLESRAGRVFFFESRERDKEIKRENLWKSLPL